MSTSTKLFLDTSFLLAFIDRGNPQHKMSVDVMTYLAKEGCRLYTSNITILTTFSRVERDMGTWLAVEFLDTMLQSNIETMHVSQSELQASIRYIRNANRLQCTLTEVINAQLMLRFGIPAVVTFDAWHNLNATKVAKFT
jgi:predicted nucleic acid-binding protein